jgi:hypothetical protein
VDIPSRLLVPPYRRPISALCARPIIGATTPTLNQLSALCARPIIGATTPALDPSSTLHPISAPPHLRSTHYRRSCAQPIIGAPRSTHISALRLTHYRRYHSYFRPIIGALRSTHYRRYHSCLQPIIGALRSTHYWQARTAWGIQGGRRTAAGRLPCGRATPQMAVRVGHGGPG